MVTGNRRPSRVILLGFVIVAIAACSHASHAHNFTATTTTESFAKQKASAENMDAEAIDDLDQELNEDFADTEWRPHIVDVSLSAGTATIQTDLAHNEFDSTTGTSLLAEACRGVKQYFVDQTTQHGAYDRVNIEVDLQGGEPVGFLKSDSPSSC
jgi:hypothetical protein